MSATERVSPASGPATPAPAAGGLSRTAWTLGALGAGLLAGILLHGSTQGRVGVLADAVAPVGQLWLSALQMTVVPLVIGQTFVAVVEAHGHGSIGMLGAKTVLLFLTMLIAAGLLTVMIVPPFLSLYAVDAATAASLRAGTAIPALPTRSEAGSSIASWLIGLVPRNIVEAASSGEILPLLLVTIVFALATARLLPQRRDFLLGVFRSVAEATMVVIGWILRVAPLGVFALCFGLAVRAGFAVAGFMAVFVALSCGMMIFVTALLYPVTAAAGRVSLRRFAAAVAPAQLVAVSTRSSLASLPALVEGARDRLGLPALATGFVLPLSVSAFKLNRTVSATVKVLFLAHVFHVHLGVLQLATFLVTVLILSFSTVGLPGGGAAFRTLPAYLAAGVPLEGVVILEAVDAIPDIFKTVTTVTGDMSAAAILSRAARTRPSA